MIKTSRSKFLLRKNEAEAMKQISSSSALRLIDEGKLHRRETSSANETKRIGEIFARSQIKKRRNKALVLGLVGELGGGKTTFLQGFAKGLGIKEKINSPTFIIMRRIKNFYHFDCYRTQGSKEILELGWKKIISGQKNIVAVEWAGKIKKIMPEKTIWINFKFINNKTRGIVLK